MGMFVTGSTISPLIDISMSMILPPALRGAGKGGRVSGHHGLATQAVAAAFQNPDGHDVPDPGCRPGEIHDRVASRPSCEFLGASSRHALDQDIEDLADRCREPLALNPL